MYIYIDRCIYIYIVYIYIYTNVTTSKMGHFQSNTSNETSAVQIEAFIMNLIISASIRFEGVTFYAFD
jgi:hypothetical protein